MQLIRRYKLQKYVPSQKCHLNKNKKYFSWIGDQNLFSLFKKLHLELTTDYCSCIQNLWFSALIFSKMGKKSGQTKSPKGTNNGSCNMKSKKGSKVNMKNVCIFAVKYPVNKTVVINRY